MTPSTTLKIRNSTAKFLMFTSQTGEGSIEVRVEEGTVWLTQKLIAALFDKSRSTIAEHLRPIFDEGEVNESAVCRNLRHTANDGKKYDSIFLWLRRHFSVTVCALTAPQSHVVLFSYLAKAQFSKAFRQCFVAFPSKSAWEGAI